MQHRLSKKERDELPALYDNGMSCPKLAEQYGISQVAINGLLRRRGVKIRTQIEAQKKCQLNENVFDKMTPESAYWIGFLFADGTIVERSGRSPVLALVLAEKDKEHIYSFREFLGSSHKILTVNYQKYYGYFSSQNGIRLAVSSARLVSALKNVGFVKHLGSIAIKELACSIHFWRGVVDGDGCIGVLSGNRAHHARLELVGGFPLLSQFVEYIHNQIPLCKISVRPHRSIFKVGLSCKTALQMIDILYTDTTISLSRKHNAAINILSLGLKTLGFAPGSRLL